MNDQVTPQQFLVFLFALACGVALSCGYWYWAFGTGPVAWGLAFVRFVKSFQPTTPIMSRQKAQTEPDEQTDRQTDQVSEADLWLDRIDVDRTKTALIELLVYTGWDVGQIRGVLKGDNGTLGVEIEAARKRLGISTEPRQIRVRDDQGERLIPMEV